MPSPTDNDNRCQVMAIPHMILKSGEVKTVILVNYLCNIQAKIKSERYT